MMEEELILSEKLSRQLDCVVSAIKEQTKIEGMNKMLGLIESRFRGKLAQRQFAYLSCCYAQTYLMYDEVHRMLMQNVKFAPEEFDELRNGEFKGLFEIVEKTIEKDKKDKQKNKEKTNNFIPSRVI